MPLTPTTWDASGAGPNAAISGGGLIYSTSNYYANGVRTVAGRDDGLFYWQYTLDLFPSGSTLKIGVDADSASESGLFWSGSVSTLDEGDVLGFAFDVAAGTLVVTRNGTVWKTLTSVARDPGLPPAWGPCIAQVDASGPVQITANFGGSAFVGTVPAGYEAGFGSSDPVLLVTGFKSAALGTPTIDYPPIISGFKSASFGSPRLVQKGDVSGLQAASAFGRVVLRTNQGANVRGFKTGRFGWISVPGGVTGPTNQAGYVAGIRGSAFGAVAMSAVVEPEVTGLRSGSFGPVRVAQILPVQGLQAGAFGVVGLAMAGAVKPVHRGAVGRPTAVLIQPVAGFSGGALGKPRAFASSSHEVSGFGGGQLGAVTGRWTYRAFPVVGRGRFGRIVLGSLPC